MTKGYRHDEIRGLYVEQLVDIWVDDWTGATRARTDKMIDRFFKGDLEYATETVSALCGMVRKSRDVEAPSPSPAVSLLWASLLCRSSHST